MYLRKEVPFQPVGVVSGSPYKEKALVEAVAVWGSSFGKMLLQYAVLLSSFKCPSCLISNEQKESFCALIENISNS